MQNKIRFLALFIAFLFVLPLSAKEKKLSNPGKNEVILIGRITVKAKEDMNFIAQTRGLTEEEKNSKSKYAIPYFSPTEKDVKDDYEDYNDDFEDFKDDNPKIVFEEGEFFYAVYKVDKKTRNLKFDSPRKYFFFGSEKTFIWLPFDFNIDVPKDVSAMYIGTFSYETVGNDFVFNKIQHLDEYDLAQEELDKVTKKHFDLYRATLKDNPKESSDKKKK